MCNHDNWQFDFANEAFYCPDCNQQLDGTELPEPEDNVPEVPEVPDNWGLWEELLDSIQ